MDHSYFKDKISAYFDGALEVQEMELLRRHLEECSDCQQLLAEFKHLHDTIEKHSSLAGDEYFEKLAQKIENKIATPAEKVVDVRPLRWKSLAWKISAAAATLLLVGTIGYYQWTRDDELPKRMLEATRGNQPAEQAIVDSAANEESKLEVSGKVVSGDEIGRRKVDLGATRTENEREQLDAVKKAPEELQQAAKQLPKAQEIVVDTVRTDDTPQLASPPVPESREAVDKKKVARAVSDEFMAGQEGLSNSLAEDKDLAQSNIDSVESLNLEDLRVQNQLLQQQVDQRQKKSGSLKDALSGQPAVSSFAQKAPKTVPDSIYQQLAFSWFQIGQITKDSVEKSQAIQYLNWYKTNFPKDSVQTNLYLKDIKK